MRGVTVRARGFTAYFRLASPRRHTRRFRWPTRGCRREYTRGLDLGGTRSAVRRRTVNVPIARKCAADLRSRHRPSHPLRGDRGKGNGTREQFFSKRPKRVGYFVALALSDIRAHHGCARPGFLCGRLLGDAHTTRSSQRPRAAPAPGVRRRHAFVSPRRLLAREWHPRSLQQREIARCNHGHRGFRTDESLRLRLRLRLRLELRPRVRRC